MAISFKTDSGDFGSLNITGTAPADFKSGINSSGSNYLENAYITGSDGSWIKLDNSADVWEINGSKVYYSGGNVGIGTNNPSTSLNIVTDAGNDGILLENSSYQMARLFNDSAYGRLSLYNSGDSYLNFSRTISFSSGMQLGLGYTAEFINRMAEAKATLDVQCAAAGHTGIQVLNAAYNNRVFYVTNEGNAHLGPDTAGLSVTESGRVGIGTTDPDALFHILGTSSQTDPAIAALGNFESLVENNDTTVNNFAKLHLRAGSADSFILGRNKGTNASELAFYTDENPAGSLQRMVITSGGNVGIGTSNPGAPLHVIGNIFGEQTVSGGAQMVLNYQGVGGDNTGSQIRLMDSDGGIPVALNSNDYSYFTGGNVGIGTSTPASLLELAGTINPELRITDTAPGSAAAATFRAENSSATLGSYSDHPLYLVANNSTKMTLLSDGNVGIGTTTPEQALDVDGRARADQFGFRDDAANPNYYFDNFGGSNFLGKDGAPILLYSNGTSTMAWDDGKVGIGTTAPNSLFVVQGENADIYLNDAAGNPSVSLAQDINGKGQVQVYNEVGNQKILLTSSGNSYFIGGKVGIGTTAPVSALELQGANTIDSRLTFLQTTTSKSGTLQQGSQGLGISALGSDNDIFLSTNGATHLTVTSGGSVGIGTNDPQGRFEVLDAGVDSSVILKCVTDDQNPYGLMVSNNTYNTSEVSGFGVAQRNDGSTRLFNNESLFMSVTTGGNVGIGTTTAAHPLEIGGAGEGIVLNSPDGTQYLVTVANGGGLTTSAV